MIGVSYSGRRRWDIPPKISYPLSISHQIYILATSLLEPQKLQEVTSEGLYFKV